MIKKVTIEEQDFVWVAVLKHGNIGSWREHTEMHVFEELENAKKWATKECHRLLYNIVRGLGVIPYASNVKWYDDYELALTIINEDKQLVDKVEVHIYKQVFED